MLTKIEKVTPNTVTITSANENVRVTVERLDCEYPKGPLTRQEAHTALTKVEEETTEFLSCVESDLHATSPN